MPDLSLRQFLQSNGFDPAAGIGHLLPTAVEGSVRYLFTTVDSLSPNQQLNVYGELVSNSRLFNLIMQNDGNLVLYRTQFDLPLWASNTKGLAVDQVIMQSDGNLVAYSSAGVAYWATGTVGHPGSSVVLQDDGNLVVKDDANNAQWASNTVQDLSATTCQYTDASGYQYDETSEEWKQLCTAFPCFALLEWPGYSTHVVEDTINGQPVVIQLWKGDCEKFLGLQNFPGGIGAEVGVYHRVPGRARPSLQQLISLGLPQPLAALIVAGIAPLTDEQLWWAFPELGTKIDFTLTDPITNQTFFAAGAEVTYWLNKWMEGDSYVKYQNDQGGQTPASPTDYLLDYRINGKSYPSW
jgi:hypothetical protein